MSSQFRTSVVIPTYNRATYVERAIRSALAETLPDDEVIVVDDGSEDDTASVLERFNDQIVVVSGGHGGAGRARNLGIARAQGDLVAFLDSDDVWLPGKLALQRQFMERRPDVLFCFGNFEVEDRAGVRHRRYLDRWEREPREWREAFGVGTMYSSFASLPAGCLDFPVYEGDLYALQLTGQYVLTDTLVVRRPTAGDALTFAEDLRTYEDLECFYRLARKGKGAFLDVDLARQFDHPHGRLSQLSFLEKIDARLTLLRRHWGADQAFLEDHSSIYQRVLANLLCARAAHLISHGDNLNAARTLRQVHSPPLKLTLLAAAPPFLTMAAFRAIRTFRRWAKPTPVEPAPPTQPGGAS